MKHLQTALLRGIKEHTGQEFLLAYGNFKLRSRRGSCFHQCQCLLMFAEMSDNFCERYGLARPREKELGREGGCREREGEVETVCSFLITGVILESTRARVMKCLLPPLLFADLFVYQASSYVFDKF